MSNLAGDTDIDPEVMSQGSCYSTKPQGLGRLWSIKKVDPIRNAESVEKLF